MHVYIYIYVCVCVYIHILQTVSHDTLHQELCTGSSTHVVLEIQKSHNSNAQFVDTLLEPGQVSPTSCHPSAQNSSTTYTNTYTHIPVFIYIYYSYAHTYIHFHKMKRNDICIFMCIDICTCIHTILYAPVYIEYFVQ